MSRFGLVAVVVLWLSCSFYVSHASAQQTHLLVVTGLGGGDDFTEQFHAWATTLVDAATIRYEIPVEYVTYLGEDPKLAPNLIEGQSTRENIELAVHAIDQRAALGDHIVIVLFGHGSFTDAARINLPRRDLSADDFSRLLETLEGRQITFINTASASGPFIEKLSGNGRTIITATKTGLERNASVFGQFFVEAFTDGEADADQNKDLRVSMLEAFFYTRAKVAQSYEADGLLATEHALLDDNGDGHGTDLPDPVGATSADGMVARTMFFSNGSGLSPDMAFPDDPELLALYEDRTILLARVDELRRVRTGVAPIHYEQELEALMIELALKSRKIRELETEKGLTENQS